MLKQKVQYIQGISLYITVEKSANKLIRYSFLINQVPSFDVLTKQKRFVGLLYDQPLSLVSQFGGGGGGGAEESHWVFSTGIRYPLKNF